MIQRVQSVLLILVFLLGITLYFVPILGFNSYENSFVMNTYHTYNASTNEVISKNIGIGALQGIIVLMAIITVFLYKKRQLQIKLCKFILLLTTLQIVATIWYIDIAKEKIFPTSPNDVVIQLNAGLFFPFISVIMLYFATRFIKKDDDLVRSADRLR